MTVDMLCVADVQTLPEEEPHTESVDSARRLEVHW